jgi:uncharacterized protein
LCKADGGLFFEATEAADTESLRRTGTRLGDYTGAPIPPRPAGWPEVLDALLALGEDRPVTVAIDEFPYLVKANPELPSVIQAAFGPRREERLRSRTRLLLCGSAMSFMGRLLSGTAPLHGRAGLEMIVPNLSVLETPGSSPATLTPSARPSWGPGSSRSAATGCGERSAASLR